MFTDNASEGLLVVLSAPSGCGKDTVLQLLSEQTEIRRSVSMTTRPKREGETDGKDYYFVDKAYFRRQIDSENMLEYTNYNGNFYGTPRTAVDEWLRQGETVVLKIEVEGGENIRRMYPDSVSIFLVPPSLSVLRERLMRRSSDSLEEIESRLIIAMSEMKQASQYDYVVVNDRLEDAVRDIRAILCAERHKTSRNQKMIREVIQNDEP